ncbi:dual specificity protein phosphatase 3-like isoform X2 [Arctopsyche grandis]|uniref:dual specificity protein phosphatase 3-like isoform X2 n=1 Tax=Arctopsyche grandis TaxID=121162 RepID=UPI00406D9021
MSWREASTPSGSTTTRHLLHVINSTRSPSHHLPGYRSPYTTSSSNPESSFKDIDCDEVYPRLFVGNEEAAKSKKYLKLMGITHVLNTAEGKHFGQVDTDHLYYRDCPRIKYLGFPLIDHPSTDISRYFYIAAKFVSEAMYSGGKVLVHCKMGVSRSATCAIAYLMIERNMSASEAIRTISRNRNIRPNEGFMLQLCKLNDELAILRK